MHRLMFSGFTARAVGPIDWLAFLRQWRLDFKEVREGRGAYYKLTLPVDAMGPGTSRSSCRTIGRSSWTMRSGSRSWPLARSRSAGFLRGADWDRASRGIVAFAIDNRDDRFSKDFDLGRADDQLVLSVFRGIELDARHRRSRRDRPERRGDRPRPEGRRGRLASGRCPAKLGLTALEAEMGPEEDLFPGPQVDAYRMGKAFLAGLKPRTEGPSVAVRVEGIGSLADVYSLIRLDFSKKIDKAKVEAKTSRAKAEEAKLAPKLERR